MKKKQTEFEFKWDELAWRLLDWYRAGHRELPWREDDDPYHIWISEIMLQQTRAVAVIPYYERFMKEVPDIKALSEIEDDRLMKLWEGLGYYSRARNLKKAAQILVSEYGGRMPADFDAIASLPGIGPYTAGAIASIAFHLPYPAVDGNVLRIMARLLCYENEIDKGASRKEIEACVAQMIPEEPGLFTQAMMELGATLCGPSGAPRCEQCPWCDACCAHAEGSQLQYPRKSPKKSRRIEHYTVLLIQDANRTAIRKRPEAGLLAGMYEFPMLEGKCGKESTLEKVREMGYNPIRMHSLPEAKHIFTHKEWHMSGYRIIVDELSQKPDTDLIFVEHSEAEKHYPMPSAFRAYMELVSIKQGNRLFYPEGE